MPEEVTYTTLKFQNFSKENELKETDIHEVPELELSGRAKPETESTVVAESRDEKGHRAESRRWCSIAVISLMLNLVVLAGLGTLGLMHYHKFIQFNYTTADETQKKIAQLEKNLSLYMNMYENVSSEHIIFKNMSENTSRELKNLTSKYCEDLKLKRKELKFNLCPQSWVWHEDSCYYFSPEQKTFQDSASDCRNNNSFLMRIDNKENWNRMQLFVRCLPSPTSWLNLTCILNEKDLSIQNESKLCTDQLTIPINISSVEKVKYEVVDGKEIIESSNESNSYYICEKEVTTAICQIQNNTRLCLLPYDG